MPLGVGLDVFHPQRFSMAVRNRWAAPGQLLLVHCGRLSVEKRVDRSIHTLAALRHSGIDARLVIVGAGPLRNRLERQAARLPVEFTGFIDSRETVAGLLVSATASSGRG